jgi:hypothetical protein
MNQNYMNFTPINGQQFMFFANYYDGTFLSEFDLANDNREGNFNSIQKNKLIRFGLIGNGMYLHFESDGVFKLLGQSFEIFYKEDDKEYYLTGRQEMYNDIIYYKDAEVFASFHNGQIVNVENGNGSINQYNFGYKASFQVEDINFNFKAICKMPFGQPVMLNLRLVSNKDMNGILVIKKSGKIVAEIEAPLESGIGGEINWQVEL